MPSPTRRAFIAKKKAKREQRAYDKWWSAHHFFCKGQTRRRGKLTACQFEVRFGNAVEGSKATCRRCKQAHVYYEGPIGGVYKQTWLTVEEHGELYIPPESLERVEDVYREIHTEKNVNKDGYMQKEPETIIIADHAPWCHHPDIPIIGLRATVGGPGRIRWRDAKGVIRHNCVSSEAGRKHGIISGQVRANTGG